MNPLVEKAKQDYMNQLKTNTYDKVFPKGSNNISSAFYNKVGGDFLQNALQSAVAVMLLIAKGKVAQGMASLQKPSKQR